MAYTLADIKVLVVDDMKPMLALVKTVLASFGFQKIYTADNGNDAFELACKHDPDFIITDWMMEPIDGLEFVDMIRKNSRTPNPYVPIIIMTGFSSKLRVEMARDQGITEFLVKPFNAKDLYTRIFQIIEKPRQFVETDEFFGPDRRRKRSQDYQGPRRRSEEPAKQNNAKETKNKDFQDILEKLSEEAKKI